MRIGSASAYSTDLLGVFQIEWMILTAKHAKIPFRSISGPKCRVSGCFHKDVRSNSAIFLSVNRTSDTALHGTEKAPYLHFQFNIVHIPAPRNSRDLVIFVGLNISRAYDGIGQS